MATRHHLRPPKLLQLTIQSPKMCGLWSNSGKHSTWPDPHPEKSIRPIPSIPASAPSFQVQPRPSGLSSQSRPSGLSSQPSQISSTSSGRSGKPTSKKPPKVWAVSTSFPVAYATEGALRAELDAIFGPRRYKLEYGGDRYRVLSDRVFTEVGCPESSPTVLCHPCAVYLTGRKPGGEKQST